MGGTYFAVCLSGALLGAAAQAQDIDDQQAVDESQRSNEIVVTAFKRAETLEDIPASISVVSGEALNEGAIASLDELSKRLPNVTIQQGAENNFIFMRGAGSGVNEGFEQSVGLFVDGVYLGRSRQFLAPFLDIENVEVLKGPQGVVLGKNTTAGAINITSTRPSYNFEGFALARYESETELRSFEGAVSGPVGDNVRVRLTGKVGWSDGFFTNSASNEEEVSTDLWLLRGSLEWDATDRTTVYLKIEGGAFDQSGVNSQISILGPGAETLGALTPTRNDPSFGGGIDSQRSLLTFRNNAAFGLPVAPARYNDERDNTETFNAVVSIDYELDEATITSVTSYSSFDMDRVFDSDYGPLPLIVVDTPGGEFSQISQELRVASEGNDTVEYLAGLYAQNQSFEITRNEHVAGSLLGFTDFSTFRTFSQDVRAFAAFGQLIWSVSPSARLRAGLRYSYEEKDARVRYDILPFLSQSAADALGAATPEVQTSTALGLVPTPQKAENDSYSDLSPSLSIEVDVLDDGLVYASIARGFKSGGFSEQITSPNSVFSFDNETALTYEVGTKLSLFNDTLRLNAAAFRTDYNNLQVTAFNGLTFDVGNAAESRAQGIELDGVWSPSELFEIGGAVAYLDSKFRSFENAPTIAGTDGVQDLSGRPTLFAPKWSGNIFLGLNKPIGDVELFTRLEATFTGAQFYQLDLDPADRQSSYSIVDLRAGATFMDGGLELSVIAKNLGNKRAKIYSFDVPVFSGTHGAFVNPPRTFVVQLEANF
ncbi:TonB-dependent receptor [Parasphingorhabdus litoris]|uniref:TonB-dependent receptor n=1 Tax=Parasphingorhabdus litoris TaxID=394733 RepID=A0ABN1A361_9SPHN|nr:TonB-dependent receptor [Parasphingorhabdus litoris]